MAIAMLTISAVLMGYLLRPQRTFLPALTKMADSVADNKRNFVGKGDSVGYLRKFPPRKQFLNLDLNSVDSAILVTAKGVGPVFAQRISDYGRRLGGYVNIEQLREVKGMTDEHFATISKNFWVDSIKITKININFVDQNALMRHPYVTPSMARRLLEARKSKGGLTNHQQLTKDNILTPREARKVAPYLMF